MKFKHYMLAIASCSVLCSCGVEAVSFKLASAGIFSASQGFFSRPDVNLKEKNYAAADYLVGQMSRNINFNHLIIAKPLEEEDHAGISSPLGSVIPEGIALRFMELGYSVNIHEVAPNNDADLYPALPKGIKPDFVLRGTYLPDGNNVDIHLRIIDIKRSAVVARFDYVLPLSREVKELSKTPVNIFKVEK